MTLITPIDAIAQTIAIANKLFFQQLQLEPTFYQGDAPVGKQYGFSMPRELNPNQEVRGGYQTYTWNLDVLVEFIINCEANIQYETSMALLKVANTISELNELVTPLPHGNTGNFTAERLSSVQSQQVRKPHHWQVTIVGSATVQSFIYRDRCGRFTVKC